ncbi:MAG: hypothetical protein WCF60_06740 [Anaerobacillus sp.]
MKNVVFIIALIGCLSLVIAGKFHWDDKIEQTGETVSAAVGPDSEVAKKSGKQAKKPVSDKELKKLVSNFPEQLQEKMMTSNDPISVVIVGSESIGTKEDGLQEVVDKGLEDSYWQGAFNVTQLTFEEATTETLVDDELYHEVIEQKPDVVLLEAFTLNDNSRVVIEDGQQNISTTISEIKDSLPGVSVMLMPSNPIPDPGYYAIQINELGKYAKKNDYIYLDHWEEWPSVDGEEINDYLTDSRPNDKGFEVWGDFIVDYMSGN